MTETCDYVLLEGIPFDPDEQALFNALHMDPAAPFAGDVRALLDQARARANPKGIYKLAAVERIDGGSVRLDGAVFSSRVMAVNLENVDRAFPFIATCGMELEQWSQDLGDMMAQFWADKIKEMALFSALTALDEHFTQTYQPGLRAAMNPGSLEDWPVSQQEPLFALFGGGAARIGVRLTESYLMFPVKSVSGVWFATERGYENCMLCPRENCPNRRAPYDVHMLTGRYAPET